VTLARRPLSRPRLAAQRIIWQTLALMLLRGAHALTMLGLTCLLGACYEERPARSVADVLRERAAADFDCLQSDIRTSTIDNRTRVARGCGQTATYVEACESCRGERCNCTWVLNSKREIEKPVAAQAPARPRPKQPSVRGTCFAIARSGHILTAEHVVSGVSDLTVQFPGGPVLDAKVAASSREDDVAILTVDAETPDYLPLSRTSAIARPGTRVFTIGFPMVDMLGSDSKFTDGSVSSLSGHDGDPHVLQMTVPIQPGNSGGPVVTETGFVIGIVTSTAAAFPFLRATGTLPQGINWAVKADYAIALIKRGPDAPAPVDRDEAVERTRRAVCAVSTKKKR
jgi:S1-C subfamily serine protease